MALTHIDDKGRLKMVDVGDKEVTRRYARASGKVRMSAETAKAVREGSVQKGEVLASARLAGIQAAKRTSDLVPLAHPLPLDHVEVELEVVEDGVRIESRVRVTARTGAEMEAMAAVAGAALCIYDMAKAMDRQMEIESIRLEEKAGGRSGTWKRE
ncbi:MAG: cyclic pyranopterin monophosphate synthase MoaC [bacterium]